MQQVQKGQTITVEPMQALQAEHLARQLRRAAELGVDAVARRPPSQLRHGDVHAPVQLAQPVPRGKSQSISARGAVVSGAARRWAPAAEPAHLAACSANIHSAVSTHSASVFGTARTSEVGSRSHSTPYER